jgi:3-dehydroquinate synthase
MQQARPLDFGHWLAHKLESLTDYQTRHGEAVAVGVAVDTAYSHLRHRLDRRVVQQTFEVLHNLRLPLWNAQLDQDAIFEGIEEFRQHLGGQLTITLIESVGQAINVHEIDRSAVREAIALVAESVKPMAVAS